MNPRSSISPRSDESSEDILSVSGKKWILQEAPERDILYYRQKLGISDLLAHILASRLEGLEEAQAFLNPSLKNDLPDPACLPDMTPALNCMVQAIRGRKKIVIWGDYDVDGATSSALWILFFRMIGLTVEAYIPDRFEEGYGLHGEGLRELRNKGVDVVIAVDCGTTAFEPLLDAKATGLDVIVIDHHDAEARIPECTALINPKRHDHPDPRLTPLTTLAAVGVSFLVVVGLNRKLREEGFYQDTQEPDLISLLDLVALGTVCDVMPLRGLNRLFVKRGLEVMKKRQNPGLTALMDVGDLLSPLSAYHLGFILGPRINAGGRVGTASLGTRLLTENDPFKAQELAQRLDHLNQERRTIEKELEQHATEQAEDQSDAPALIVHGEGWHQGVIGIIAGRLKERFHKPTFVISFDKGEGKGSARSVTGLDIGELILQAVQKGSLTKGGGHPMAGGFSLSPDTLEAFKAFMLDRVHEHLGPIPPAPVLTLDLPVTFRALTQELIQELEVLAPFGVGHPQPMLVFHQVMVRAIFPLKDQHLRIDLEQLDGTRITGMAFRSAETPLGHFLMEAHKSGTLFSVAGTAQLNHFRATPQPQIILADARP